MDPGMNAALAIFVKSPRYSPIKTRLAKDVGAMRAEAIYLACVKRMETVATTARSELGITPHWAVAEREALANPLWSRFDRLAQMGETLGERLHSIYSELRGRYPAVMLVGADSPELSLNHLRAAISQLSLGKTVIGPARDGGFYLFGSGEILPESFWTAIAYSQHDTCQRLVAKLVVPLAYLPVLSDIDTVEDYRALESFLSG